ncbi:hypothetical protein [Sinorhizobium meliloti]|uniref:hypothetical protein n=1 Tax=Rhizobium meliloti TaxID=382 RepID=UPI000FE0CBBC|nr:hypothetical protein [Sinorhizobium meliloti]MDW9814282.1 hypothetical protein [Sinorhizobium meliloti]MDX0260606.1 hypothetical protein [Sinorhizobium meliloti]MDX0347699.1 hypothetical protein [Sinorhizobium meliloti]RVO88248.1 hypothetical protein CN089_30440 [Sinorhizobium meliloti]
MAKRPSNPDQLPKFYFAPARQYLQLFAIAQKQTPKIAGDEFHLAFPKRMLLGFSLELYLKAWLRFKDVSSDDLQYKYGHKIESLFTDAQAKGLTAWRELHDAVSQLAPQHADFGFRYIREGSFYMEMDYNYITWILCALDETIADAIPDITSGHEVDLESLRR